MKHALTDNIIMIAELIVREDRVDDLLDYIVCNLAVSRSYPGNIEFEILVDETRPGQVLFYEVWESAEAQQAYMGWRVQAGDLTTLMSFLSAEPRFTALRRVAGAPHSGR